MSEAIQTAGQSMLATATGAFVPRNFDEALRMAEEYASSDMVPKDYRGKRGNVIVAMQLGAELGLMPMQAMESIAVINGRPSVYGDAMPALCMRSGDWGGMEETAAEGSATCRVTRYERIQGKPVPRTVESTYTMEDAKIAGLAGKDGPWKTSPKRMLKMRARAFALRDLFPDVLRGLRSAEEAGDAEEAAGVIDASVVSVTTEAPAAAPAKGVAGLKGKLGARVAAAPSEPATAPDAPARVGKYVAALSAAQYLEQIEDVSRDVGEIWSELSELERAAVTAAGKSARERVAGEMK